MYRIKMIFPDEEAEILDEEFEEKAVAKEMGAYYCNCYKTGGEVLNYFEPETFPLVEDDEATYEVIEV